MKNLVLIMVLVLVGCSSSSLTDFVDPFIGTGGHGHTFPGATRPFAMVQLSPDTRLDGWDGCSGYHYSDSIIYGFSHTHLSGTGVSDYGDLLLMPFSGETRFNNGTNGEVGYRSTFDKKTEKASAGYYEVVLTDHQVKVELTSTERVGFHRYTFTDFMDRRVLIDLDHRDLITSTELTQISPYEISGHRHSKAWAEDQKLFFYIKFDQPVKGIEWKKEENKGVKAALDFDLGRKELLVKVGISSVDIEGAKANMNAELPGWNFDRTKIESQEIWESQLSKIEVEGGSEAQKRVFYTALYHTMLSPNLFMDADGRYRGRDQKIHQSDKFTNYSVFSLWDTYRSAHPLYTLIEQKRSNDFINTFLAQFEEGGRLPVWELAANETDCMIGYHSVPVITDAYMKGIRDFDADLALKAMIHSAMQNRLGIDHYRNDGFIPSEKEAESVSKTLEYAYDDWAIGVFAQALGKEPIAEEFLSRGQQYKNMFDPSTGFMRARLNNQWFAPFKPEEVNFHYTEANAWQYSYYVPQDISAWAEMLGGFDQLEQKLDDLFSANSATSGREQADITGLIGQYAHGNEPSHHIPYLYNFTGAAQKTQKLVRQIMNELYSDQPDGLSGNEDCGQMSSWLVFSAMGFYPVTPGSTDYIIGSPWFDKITLNLENGKQFEITANNQSKENVFVKSVQLNGKDHPHSFLGHETILGGGQMLFEMSATPTEFGNKVEHRPSTTIKSAELIAIPAVLGGDRAFQESTTVALNCATKEATIFYSTDNQANQKVYTAPFEIKNNTTLTIWAQKGDLKSKVGKSEFFKIPEQRKIKLATQYANHYTGGGDLALIDFLSGHADFRAGGWQGYEGVDLDATVELEKAKSLRQLSIRFLQDENAWIFMPLEVEFLVSTDGINFNSVGKVVNDISTKQKGSIIKTFTMEKSISAKYVKVVGKNRGTCPPDHKGAGGKSWIFADEIMIN